MKNYLAKIMLMTILLSSPLAAQSAANPNSADLQIALRKLNVLGSVLYIGAHPDDENTSLLAYLSKGRAYRAAYLSLTRGEGGQNLIGPEQGAAIGIIRTQELLSARRIDGAEQFFTRAVDFGYTKTAEESFAFWGRENILADIVWVIRCFQPDVIMTRFTPENSGGHGHHTAASILTIEAFKAAADSTRFPEQLKFVAPWQAKRLFWNNFYRPAAGDKNTGLLLDVGEYNPLLGKSYAEMAGEIRSQHKSQGFGSAGRRGSQPEQFTLLAGEPATHDIFDGIDTSWQRLKNGKQISLALDTLLAAFDMRSPAKSVPALLAVYRQLNQIAESPWLAVKKRDLLRTIQACAGLWLEALADDYAVAPHDNVHIKTSLINRSDLPMSLQSVRFPGLDSSAVESHPLKSNEIVTMESHLAIPQDFPISQPYWLEQSPLPGLTIVADQQAIGRAENTPSLRAVIGLTIAGQALEFEVPVLYRWADPVAGERTRMCEIRPAVTVECENKVQVFTGPRPLAIKVRVKSHTRNATGMLRLLVPSTWSIQPAQAPFSLANKYDECEIVFQATGPKTACVDEIVAQAEINGTHYERGLVEIAYPHIRQQVYFPASAIKALVLEVKNTARQIGYIMGAGDDVPEAMRMLGCSVILLSDDMLASVDLSAFDAIVTGVRAFNTRDRLKLAHDRLLQYVERGGTLVEQYNVASNQPLNVIAPYPLSIGRERVCVETAPVTILDTTHQLLTYPNLITAKDFEGWIQERGLYFASQWDGHYQALLACHDPGEQDHTGGLLFTRYGKGVFIYTAYSWFRQLPAGVPGAFRIWANLISAGKGDATHK